MRESRRPGVFCDRGGAVAWARAVACDPDTVYLDTETTGLADAAEILEVAVVAGDGRVLLDTLVRPRQAIPRDATRIHGIGDGDVVGAPDWRIVNAYLCQALVGRRVIVYNAEFDRRLVAQSCRLHGVPAPDCAWECAMRAFAAFRAEPAGFRGDFRWHRLEVAVATFGAPPGGHRALGDALACRAVVRGMAGVR